MRDVRRSRGFSRFQPLPTVALALALVVVGALVAWPVAALVIDAVGVGAPTGRAGVPSDADAVPTTISLAVLARSLAWSIGASLAGTLLAWPASRAFRRHTTGLGNRLCAVCILLAAVLPPWLSSASLWMSTGPGTAAGDFFERLDAIPVLRAAILAVATTTWSAGIAFAVLSLAGPRGIATDARLLAIDGASSARRANSALARDARALLVAITGSALFLLGETTVFDLAQVGTYGFELRTLDALGAPPHAVLVASLPVVAIVAAGLALLPAAARGLGSDGLRLRPREGDRLAARGQRWPSPSMLLAALPMAVVSLLVSRMVIGVPRGGDFLALHGRSILSTLACASAAATIAALVAAGLRVVLDAPARSVVRRGGMAIAGLLLLVGLSPATLTALAAEAGYNRPMLGAIYDSAAIVVLVLVVRAAPVASIVAIALAAREASSSRRLRELDSATLAGAARAWRGELALAAIATFAMAFVWSISELIASGRVAPPGLRWMATDVLNAIHYQRPETVMLAAGALLTSGLVGLLAVLFVALRRPARSRFERALPALVLLLGSVCSLPACGRDVASPEGAPEDREFAALLAATPKVERPLAVDRAFAGVGRGKGQFNAPRVVAVDERDGSTYAIDKDARIQRFSPEGEVLAEWRMPKSDRGKPVGASVAPSGELIVADTHEHRLVCFSPDGEIRWTLGSYGSADGAFFYPTDIAFAPDGRMFVAEYGGNDRIQVFSAERRFLYAFGRCGTGQGEFLRPQSIAFDADRDELYVADAGNHRVQVFTSDGEFRRALGSVGLEPGQLSYPFGVVLEVGGLPARVTGEAAGGIDPSGARRTIIVAEHSNHRIQRLDAQTGRSLGVAGGLGREEGRLKYAWAVAAAGRSSDGSPRFAVCDQGNSRIAFFSFPFERE